MYYEAKKEMLILLYRHTLLIAEQAAISLHYKPKTIHNIVCELKEKGLIRHLPPFSEKAPCRLYLNLFRGEGGSQPCRR